MPIPSRCESNRTVDHLAGTFHFTFQTFFSLYEALNFRVVSCTYPTTGGSFITQEKGPNRKPTFRCLAVSGQQFAVTY